MWRIIAVYLPNAFESDTNTPHFRYRIDGDRVVRMLNEEAKKQDSFPEYLWRLVAADYELNSED